MGQPLTVWRTAYDQRRPYLDLSDAVSAVKFIIKRDLFGGGLYNVVTANATVRDIVAMVKRHVPDVATKFVSSRVMNQLSYEVHSDRLRGQGFRFRGSLVRAIVQTVSLLQAACGLRKA